MSERKQEEEYFAKLDREKNEALRLKLEAEQRDASAAERKQLHHHKCGKCGEDMVTSPFRGVEIEVCPSCGAVLLDSGELEQLAGHDQSGLLNGLFSFIGANRR